MKSVSCHFSAFRYKHVLDRHFDQYNQVLLFCCFWKIFFVERPQNEVTHDKGTLEVVLLPGSFIGYDCGCGCGGLWGGGGGGQFLGTIYRGYH